MRRSAIVQRVIALSEAINAYWDRELPRRCPSYPLIWFSDDLGPPPPEREELRTFLLTLPPAVLADYLKDGLRKLAETGREVDELLG